MKKFNQAFVLAIVTLMSASAFAADSGVGQKTNADDCKQVANNTGAKDQKASNVQSDDAKNPTNVKDAK